MPQVTGLPQSFYLSILEGRIMESQEIISGLVARARIAQAQIADYTQEQIDRVCTAIAWEVYNDENIAKLAELAVSETGMGSVADKITKHKNKVLGVIDDVRRYKSVGLIEEDTVRGIKKYAKPVGVIGALCALSFLLPEKLPSALANSVALLPLAAAALFAASWLLSIFFYRKREL